MERTVLKAQEARNVLYHFVAAAAASAADNNNFVDSVITVKIKVMYLSSVMTP